MSVNLRAVATLNARPFLASLREIQTATNRLNAAARTAAAAARTSIQEQIAARENAARAINNETRAVERGARATRARNYDEQLHNQLLRDAAIANNAIAQSYGRMSRAEAAHYANRVRHLQNLRALSHARGSGIVGPALDPYINRVHRSEVALARSRAALTAATNRQTAANTRLAASQTAVAATARGMNAATNSMTAQRHALRDVSRHLTGWAVMFAALPALSLGFATAWEHSFSNVVRTADPAFTAMESKVRGLRGSLVALVQVMPTSFGAVTEIATLANQMGIASSQVASFTRAVAMFSATSGVSVDLSATAFGRLTSILGDNRLGFLEMADAILKVGVNSVATEEEIINVTTQISSIAAQAGFGGKEIIALSGALASVRVPPELSRGLVTRVFGKIDSAVASSGSQLATLARVSGMTVDEFKNNWGDKGAAGVFNRFLQGLMKGGAAARGELNALGITSVRDVPVLLRLANAADSEGVVGGLFAQTLRDANNAAGETQRQYTIMSETVVSRLKVLGNNLLAFFDAAGKSGLGVFGDIIDSISDGLRTLTRNLDKPLKILGTFELPVTNADALGAMMSLGLVAAGFLAAAAAAAKMRSAFIGVRQVSMGLMAMAPVQSMMSTLGATFTRSAVGAGRFGGAISTSTTALGRFMGGARGVVSFLGGPWTLAAAGAIALVYAISQSAKDARTNVDGLSESFANIDVSNLQSLNVLLGRISSSVPTYLFSSEGVKPFEDGVQSVLESLKTLQDFESVNAPAPLIDLVKGLKLPHINQGFEDLDKILGNLADSGNGTKVMETLLQLGKSGVDLSHMLNSGNMDRTKEYLQNLFDLAGIEMTDINLRKLGLGTLPQVTDAMYGFAGATKVAMELFDGDAEAVGAFTEALGEATASFIDFSAAAEAAFNPDTEDFSLSKYIETLRKQIEDQTKWSENMNLVSDYVSPELLQELSSDTSAHGKAAMAALADAVREGSPEVLEAFEQLEENLAAQSREGYDTETGVAFRNWASRMMGDEDLGRSLKQALTEIEMGDIQTAAEGVTREVIDSVLRGLESDELSFDEALLQLKLKAELEPVVELDDKAKKRAEAALNNVLGKLVPSTPDGLTFGLLQNYIDDPALKSIELDATLSLTEAYAQSREFQVWAQGMGIDILIGADDSPAKQSLFLLQAQIDGTVSKVSVDALTEPATNHLWDFVELADGTTAFVQVDADTGKAQESIWQVDDMGVVTEIPITADNADAIAKILEARRNANDPAVLNITANDLASSAIDHISRNRTVWLNVKPNGMNASALLNHTNAFGNIYEAYGKGGIREDHRPQIAPAGAMRLWAEPETGGEAYIPFAKDRRKRAVAILDNVAERFGYSLTRGDVARYAAGGVNELQSRAHYGRMRNSGTTYDDVQQMISIIFNNPVTRDPLKQLREDSEKIASGIWG